MVAGRDGVAGVGEGEVDGGAVTGVEALLRWKHPVHGMLGPLEVLERLAELGCHQAQGYFFARPMPADQLPGWLSSWGDRPDPQVIAVSAPAEGVAVTWGE